MIGEEGILEELQLAGIFLSNFFHCLGYFWSMACLKDICCYNANNFSVLICFVLLMLFLVVICILSR